MTSIFVGIVFITAGVFGLIHWFPDFLLIIRGLGPISLLLGGTVSLIAGFASVQARRVDEKSKS